MKRPPLLMRIRVKDENKDFGLWLPLFLLLPLALVVLIILSPLVLIGLLVLWPSGWGPWAARVLGVAFPIFCSMRGLTVEVQNKKLDRTVYLTVV